MALFVHVYDITSIKVLSAEHAQANLFNHPEILLKIKIRVCDLLPCFMRESHPVQCDHYSSAEADIVLQGDLRPRDLPLPRLAS